MVSQLYDIYVGTNVGYLKGVLVNKNSWLNLNTGQNVGKQKEIKVFCWDSPLKSKIYAGLKNRDIISYDCETKEFSHCLSCPDGEGDYKGLALADDSFITCLSSGLLKVWKPDGTSIEQNVGSDVWKMKQNQQDLNMVATGGKENDLKIWDLNKLGESVFKAKNVRNDFLNMRVPIWVTDMEFIKETKQIVTCTGYHKVRLYDTSTSQRRPVLDFEWGEYPFTCLSVRPNQTQIVVGNTQGGMALMDIRKGAMVHCFKGFSGSIRDVKCHDSLPYVVSCGLDRFLRIHDLNTKEILHKVYLKSTLNCLLLKNNWNDVTDIPDEEEAELSPLEKIDESDDDDDIWDQIETLNANKRKIENLREKSQTIESKSKGILSPKKKLKKKIS